MQIVNVIIDCADPARLAPFWEGALGYQRAYASENYVFLTAADRGRPNLGLQRVPEPKSGKNRVHVDVGALDMEAEISRLEGLGATRGQSFDMGVVRWTAMADPDGNEFCVSHSDSSA